MDQRTARFRTGFPEASVGRAWKRTTSPVRTVCPAGSSARRVTGLAMTSTVIGTVAAPAFAVIVARPGVRAENLPSALTDTTAGALEANRTGSSRRSFWAL